MNELSKMIPHSGSMLLLSRLVSTSKLECISEVDVRETDLFCSDGQVPSWVGTEYIAQTVALYGGSQSDQLQTESKIGFLLGIRKYRSQVTHFTVGSTLRIRIEPIAIDSGVGSYSGKIEVGGQIVAEANLTILKPDEMQLQKIYRGEK